MRFNMFPSYGKIMSFGIGVHPGATPVNVVYLLYGLSGFVSLGCRAAFTWRGPPETLGRARVLLARSRCRDKVKMVGFDT